MPLLLEVKDSIHHALTSPSLSYRGSPPPNNIPLRSDGDSLRAGLHGLLASTPLEEMLKMVRLQTRRDHLFIHLFQGCENKCFLTVKYTVIRDFVN